jgi:hypothetical protein
MARSVFSGFHSSADPRVRAGGSTSSANRRRECRARWRDQCLFGAMRAATAMRWHGPRFVGPRKATRFRGISYQKMHSRKPSHHYLSEGVAD